MASNTELAALQAFIDRNPEIQSRVAQLAKDSQGRGIGARGRDLIHGAARDVRAAFDKAGITIPQDYVFDLGSGRIVKREGIPAWAFALPAIAFAPMAVGALGATGAGAAAGASALPGASAAPALGTLIPATAPGVAAGAGGLSTAMLGRFGSKIALSAIGSGLGAAADSAAGNRSTTAEMIALEETLNQRRREAYQSALEAREKDRRESGETAFREAQRSSYVAEGGRPYTPRPGLPSYGFGPTAPTEAERQAAAAYLAENRRRLDAGDSLLPAPVDPGAFTMPESVTKPGTFEKLAGIGAPIINILDALRRK